MGLEILVLIFIIMGVLYSLSLRGRAARVARNWYIVGLCLALGGCFGALSWLGGETSGSRNFANSINPYIWTGIFLVGLGIIVANSLRVIYLRSQQRQEADTSPPTDSGSNDMRDC